MSASQRQGASCPAAGLGLSLLGLGDGLALAALGDTLGLAGLGEGLGLGDSLLLGTGLLPGYHTNSHQLRIQHLAWNRSG